MCKAANPLAYKALEEMRRDRDKKRMCLPLETFRTEKETIPRKWTVKEKRVKQEKIPRAAIAARGITAFQGAIHGFRMPKFSASVTVPMTTTITKVEKYPPPDISCRAAEIMGPMMEAGMVHRLHTAKLAA